MKKVTSVFVAILLLAVAASAVTQPCDREWSIFADYTHTPSDVGDDDAGGVGAGVSQYITNDVSIGLQGWMNWGNKGDATVLGGNAKYHFMPMDPISPYLGGQVNYVYQTATNWAHHADGILWGPIVGVAFKVADRTNLFVEYQWQLYEGEARHLTREGSSIVVGLGFGF